MRTGERAVLCTRHPQVGCGVDSRIADAGADATQRRTLPRGVVALRANARPGRAGAAARSAAACPSACACRDGAGACAHRPVCSQLWHTALKRGLFCAAQVGRAAAASAQRAPDERCARGSKSVMVAVALTPYLLHAGGPHVRCAMGATRRWCRSTERRLSCRRRSGVRAVLGAAADVRARQTAPWVNQRCAHAVALSGCCLLRRETSAARFLQARGGATFSPALC